MNKRRLLKLADLLEADAKNKKGIKFDLGTVGVVDDVEDIGAHCGTTACAMGLAAVSGAFKRAGLGYTVIGNSIRTTLEGHRVDYKEAAGVVFDISLTQAGFLFSPASYEGDQTGAKGERFVAKRIRDLVAGKIAAPKWF